MHSATALAEIPVGWDIVLRIIAPLLGSLAGATIGVLIGYYSILRSDHREIHKIKRSELAQLAGEFFVCNHAYNKIAAEFVGAIQDLNSANAAANKTTEPEEAATLSKQHTADMLKQYDKFRNLHWAAADTGLAIQSRLCVLGYAEISKDVLAHFNLGNKICQALADLAVHNKITAANYNSMDEFKKSGSSIGRTIADRIACLERAASVDWLSQYTDFSTSCCKDASR